MARTREANFGRGDARDLVRQFVREGNFTWPQILDANGEVSKLYGVQAIPFTLLIGRDGKIAAVNLRPRVNPEGRSLDAAVREAVQKTTP